MFAPMVAKAQTKAAAPQSRKVEPQCSTLAARPFAGGAVDQLHMLRRSIGNEGTLRPPSQREFSPTGKEAVADHEQDAQSVNTTAQGATPCIFWDFGKIHVFPPDRANPRQGRSSLGTTAVSGVMQPKLAIGRVDDPLEHEADRVAELVMRKPDPATSIRLQAKLGIGAVDDPLEHEADRVADQVMRMPEPTAAAAMPLPSNGASPTPVSAVRRLCTACAEAEEESALRGKRTDPNDENLLGKLNRPAPPVTEGLEQQIDQLGASAPLPPQERSFFEPRFGHDFSTVRVHTDAPAAALAQRLNARAFTLGRQIVFDRGQFSSGADGRHLLAHELAHFVQHRSAPPHIVRRDLATAPPEPAPAAQPDLTKAQIDAAIRFNKFTYDEARTRQLQNLIGTDPTGVWTEQDILAVAALQEQYGLAKDGMIGPRTFEFLDRETRAEKLDKTDEKCLLAFRVGVDAPTAGPLAAGHFPLHGGFAMRAQFSQYCGCSGYQYRQFIRGHLRQIRGGAVIHDFAGQFHIPAGPLQDATFIEDGNDADAVAANYGHRDQGNEGALNGYFDDAAGTTNDQAAGCFYLGHDAPGTAPGSPGLPAVAGDIFDAFIDFRGEIRRGGKVVETQYWAAVNGHFTA